MKDKIYEFTLNHILTAPIRKKIDKFLTTHANKMAWTTSFEWDDEDDHLLHIKTYPVKWELRFSQKKVTVFGTGPVWARMLFTQKKREQLREGMHQVLIEVGLIDKPHPPARIVKRTSEVKNEKSPLKLAAKPLVKKVPR